VREALLKLRGEGMVQLEPHRGHVVLPLTRQDIEDIFWLQATMSITASLRRTRSASPSI
jgi:DNA-binding GntR family transcriptional regulator